MGRDVSLTGFPLFPLASVISYFLGMSTISDQTTKNEEKKTRLPEPIVSESHQFFPGLFVGLPLSMKTLSWKLGHHPLALPPPFWDKN